jgi:hypothetical protein
MMSEKMGPRPTCINNLGTATFSPSALFTWSISFAFRDMMTCGWLLKASTKNDQIASLILEYTFLHLASTQKMPALPVDSCWSFLIRAFFLLTRVLCGMPSTHAQSRWLGTPVTFSGKGALKVSIT